MNADRERVFLAQALTDTSGRCQCVESSASLGIVRRCLLSATHELLLMQCDGQSTTSRRVCGEHAATAGAGRTECPCGHRVRVAAVMPLGGAP